MNNYVNYQDYYDNQSYQMNQQQMQMQPGMMQQDMPRKQNMSNMQQVNPMMPSAQIYDPYNGFIRGNMFPDLFEPYKVKKPYEIQPMNGQAELLTHIDSLSFAAHELNLYLDNFPDNRQMIELYNQYSQEAKKVMNDYESKYGPLLVSSDANRAYPWAWNNQPWPWEN